MHYFVNFFILESLATVQKKCAKFVLSGDLDSTDMDRGRRKQNVDRFMNQTYDNCTSAKKRSVQPFVTFPEPNLTTLSRAIIPALQSPP